MIPKYDLEKIKFATDSPTFDKAIGLYERGCVTQFSDQIDGFSALVIGSNPYHVFVSAKYYDEGSCECYLGQEDILCKHMVVVAIYALRKGEALSVEDKRQGNQIIFSGSKGNLSNDELAKFKSNLSIALRYIKGYRGPSRIWFSYQNSLEEGCNRLSVLLSTLPVSRQTAKLVVNLLLRLDKKLSMSGVDDSNGTVGGFMEEAVKLLIEFAKIDPESKKEFETLKGRKTCFGWEEPLTT